MTPCEKKEMVENAKKDRLVCWNVLHGNTVNGVRLGMAGITKEWLRDEIKLYDRIIKKYSESK